MAGKSSRASRTIYTLGYSTRTYDYFLSLLQTYGVKLVIDIRTIPKSRFRPEFNAARLKRKLHSSHIDYLHFPGLGGLRHPAKDSLNTGWENASFRGFADYMQTPEFKRALLKLEKIAKTHTCVLLCAEAVPWRCHRSLVADALTIRKWKVFHIQSRKTAKQHELTAFLQAHRGKMLYPKKHDKKHQK